ncbi:hypothetical protein [Aporhodopirellula aestuarii]|uniref:Uncharacterized protein n=1 Tax=Aporhodopirellula aestuarii TaxID=2950107 RepID=A0ABT0U0L7_9BACT|nr:hypothetical protein [Aporhodopirellula aestuarii]MCM2370385.1 hypothetical protein [Aporhodopirellula aestuarii]
MTTNLTAFQWELILFTLRGGDSPADTGGQHLKLDKDDIEYLSDGLRDCNLLHAVQIATEVGRGKMR